MSNLPVEEKKRIESSVSRLLTQAESATIVSDDDYENCLAMQREIKSQEKTVEEFIGPIVKQAHTTWKQAVAQRDALLAPLQSAYKLYGRKCGEYQKVLEDRRKKIEEELLEQQRMAAAERARQSDEYAATKAFGDEPEAQAIIETAVQQVVPIKVESVGPKVSGSVVREAWKFEITDDSLIPREYLMPDEKAIGAMVRTRKGATNIPGVRVYTETTVSQRGV